MIIPEYQRHADKVKDKYFWDGITNVAAEMNTPELLGVWPAYVRRIDVIRFLAHVDLFNRIWDIPGNIVEIGVCHGMSFFTWHKLLEIFLTADTSRKVIGFDSFEGLKDFRPQDGPERGQQGKRSGGWGGGEEVIRLLELHNSDGAFGSKRGEIVKGMIHETLCSYVVDHPGMRISLLHLDCDLYEPTLLALETLWDLIVPGGLVVFDEFALPPWEGETRAWEEFAKKRDLHYTIRKLPWALTPNGYLVK